MMSVHARLTFADFIIMLPMEIVQDSFMEDAKETEIISRPRNNVKKYVKVRLIFIYYKNYN